MTFSDKKIVVFFPPRTDFPSAEHARSRGGPEHAGEQVRNVRRRLVPGQHGGPEPHLHGCASLSVSLRLFVLRPFPRCRRPLRRRRCAACTCARAAPRSAPRRYHCGPRLAASRLLHTVTSDVPELPLIPRAQRPPHPQAPLRFTTTARRCFRSSRPARPRPWRPS